MDTRSGLPQGVSGTAHGAYELVLPGRVYLFPEVGDVDVDQVGRQGEVVIPHPREEEFAGEHAAMVSGHELEQVVLAGRQLYLPVGPPHLAGGGVDLQVSHAQDLIPLRPPEQGSDAGQELLDVEWFGEVVVGAEVEAVDLVERGVAGGKHDNRYPATPLAHSLQHPDPVQRGEHYVEDDEGRRKRLCFFEAGDPVVGAPHVETEVLELGLDEAGDGTVVLHQQYPGSPFHKLFAFRRGILRPVLRARVAVRRRLSRIVHGHYASIMRGT